MAGLNIHAIVRETVNFLGLITRKAQELHLTFSITFKDGKYLYRNIERIKPHLKCSY